MEYFDFLAKGANGDPAKTAYMDMRNMSADQFLMILVLAVVWVAIIVWVLQISWNASITEVFSTKQLTYVGALGLLVVAMILIPRR
jgi:hypothetical protein